jgi:hypothetical protein
MWTRLETQQAAGRHHGNELRACKRAAAIRKALSNQIDGLGEDIRANVASIDAFANYSQPP